MILMLQFWVISSGEDAANFGAQLRHKTLPADPGQTPSAFQSGLRASFEPYPDRQSKVEVAYQSRHLARTIHSTPAGARVVRLVSIPFSTASLRKRVKNLG